MSWMLAAQSRGGMPSWRPPLRIWFDFEQAGERWRDGEGERERERERERGLCESLREAREGGDEGAIEGM